MENMFNTSLKASSKSATALITEIAEVAEVLLQLL